MYIESATIQFVSTKSNILRIVSNRLATKIRSENSVNGESIYGKENKISVDDSFLICKSSTSIPIIIKDVSGHKQKQRLQHKAVIWKISTG